MQTFFSVFWDSEIWFSFLKNKITCAHLCYKSMPKVSKKDICGGVQKKTNLIVVTTNLSALNSTKNYYVCIDHGTCHFSLKGYLLWEQMFMFIVLKFHIFDIVCILLYRKKRSVAPWLVLRRYKGNFNFFFILFAIFWIFYWARSI
jgi:hypothetical protein